MSLTRACVIRSTLNPQRIPPEHTLWSINHKPSTLNSPPLPPKIPLGRSADTRYRPSREFRLGQGLVPFLIRWRFIPVKRSVAIPLLVTLLALIQSGCMSRRITVRTQPPGALVEMNGERLGLSPASKNFIYYGDNEIKLSLPGYETMVVQQPTRAPWYQIPPFDFITDNFLPFRVRDHREYTYTLNPRDPLQELDEQSLRNRGENFRSQSQSGPILP